MAGRQPRSGGISLAQRVSAGDRDPIPTEPRSGDITLDRANPSVAAPRLTPENVSVSQRSRAGLTECRRSAAGAHFSQTEKNRRQLARTTKNPAREGARRNLAPGSARGKPDHDKIGGREGGRHNNPTSPTKRPNSPRLCSGRLRGRLELAAIRFPGQSPGLGCTARLRAQFFAIFFMFGPTQIVKSDPVREMRANLAVAAPRLTPNNVSFSQRSRAGLTKCRRSAAGPGAR
jgi:hypothetical protein